MTTKFRIDHFTFNPYQETIENKLFDSIEEAKTYAMKNYYNQAYGDFWITKITIDEMAFYCGEEQVTIKRSYWSEAGYIKNLKEKIKKFEKEIEIKKFEIANCCVTENGIALRKDRIQRLEKEIAEIKNNIIREVKKTAEKEEKWNNAQ